MKLEIVKITYNPSLPKPSDAYWPANGNYQRAIVETVDIKDEDNGLQWIHKNSARLIQVHGNTLFAHYLDKPNNAIKVHGIGGIDEQAAAS